MKKLGILIAFLVMLSVTISATALISKSITRDNGVSAYGWWSETTDNGYEYTNLAVMENDKGTDLYVNTCKFDNEGNGSCRDGFAFTTDDVLTVDKKLNSATLSSVAVDMVDWNTGEITTVPVQASWTSNSDLIRSNSHSISKSSDFTFKFSGKLNYRTAVVTATLDGTDLGTSSYAEIDQFNNAYMIIEK